MVAGKRSGELRPPAKKKKRGETAPDPEQQMDAGQVPAEAQAEHVEPPKANLSPEQELTLLANTYLPAWKSSLENLAGTKAVFDKAKSDHQLVGKKIKAEMGGARALDIIKLMVEFEKEGAEESIRERIEMELRVAKFMACDVGTQLDWVEDREPAVDKATRIGRAESLQGKRFDPSRYAQGTPQLTAYEKAYYAAQEERIMLLAGPAGSPPAIGDQPPTHVDAEQKAEEWPAEGQPPKPQTEVASA